MHKTKLSLEKVTGPLILCGDLNVNPTSATLRDLDSLNLKNLTVDFGLTTTLSSAHRLNRDLVSDYILVSPTLAVASFYMPEMMVSDHNALVVMIDV